MTTQAEASTQVPAGADSSGKALSLVRSSLRGHKDSVQCLCSSDDQQCIASGSSDGTCRLWDLRAEHRSVRAASVGGEVTGVALMPRQGHMLLASCGTELLAFDLRSSRVILREADAAFRSAGIAREEINQVVIDSSGSQAAIAEDSGAVHLLDLSTWRLEKTMAGKQGHQNICSSVAWRPKGWGLASGGLDATVMLWARGGRGRKVQMQPDPGEETASNSGPQLLNPPFVHSVSYSPDGRSLAAGLGDGTVALLDPDNGDQQRRLRGVHGAAVAQVLFAPIGLFSAGNDEKW